MSRAHRPLLLLLLLGFVLGLAQAPAALAQLSGPTLLRICAIRVIGLGGTETQAIQDAKDQLYADYFVSSYTVVYRGCDYSASSDLVSLPPCRAELNACGFPKMRFP